MNPAFWKGKRVLLTGHTGFKGSWLSLWLQSLGADLYGYALDPASQPNLYETAHVMNGMQSIYGDVRDLNHLKQVFSEYQPEIIIHMAAQSLVQQGYRYPVETYSVNVMGTVTLLEAVRQSQGVRLVINVTSDKCYENTNSVQGHTESDPLGGYDPYSSSKGCAELITASYRNAYFMDQGIALATVRAGNVLGGGDWGQNRLIPDLMQGLLENRPIEIRNPNSIRPWQHVLDPLEGYLTLAEHLWKDGAAFSEAWNFGPEPHGARTVASIAESLTGAWKGAAAWEIDTATYAQETSDLRLDASKARLRLGWSPKLSIETTLEWIIEWYKRYQTKDDMRQLTQQQISRCQDLVTA